MPSKYEMLKALVPEAYENPRHEGHFSNPEWVAQGWTKDGMRSDSVEKEERPFNEAMLKLEELAKKDPKYLEELISKAHGENFELEPTYNVLSKENPSREEIISALHKEHPQDPDSAFESKIEDRIIGAPRDDDFNKIKINQWSDEDLKYNIRNYAPTTLMRTASLYSEESGRKDKEDLTTGKRKPRNLDELRQLSRMLNDKPMSEIGEGDKYYYETK